MDSGWRWSWLLLVICLFCVQSASAQTGANARLTPPQTEDFPRISIFLDVSDAQGKFMHGLQAADVTIHEDGEALPLVEFQELRPGVQLVIALNPGRPFVIRDSQGFSRYDLIIQSLAEWAQRRLGSSLDDLSLLVTNGPERSHVSNPLELFYVLEEYQVSEQSSGSGIDVLLQAVELAGDPTPRPGMERMVLFVTAPLEGDLSFALQNVIDRARQRSVHVYVWLVAPPEAFLTRTADDLIRLAGETGGQFAAFSSDEIIPDLETYLDPLRDIYFIAYDSKIKAGGQHELKAVISTEKEVIASPPQAFEFDLRPPNLAFLLPELEIVREPTAEKSASASPEASLYPQEVGVQVLFDFPDGRPRPVAYSALYVDEQVVHENRAEPFDQFTWDLQAYNQSGQHILRAEAIDSLGLRGSTIDTPVVLQVKRPAASLLTGLTRHIPVIAGVMVGLSGLVLVLVMIVGGRIRPDPHRTPRRKRRPKNDPTLQPVKVKSGASGRRGLGWTNRLQWSDKRHIPKACAHLSRLVPGDQTSASALYAITANEVTIGRDARQAMLVLDDASVDGLHARLVRQEDGSFQLFDEGSVAGTWLNYSPVPSTGARLHHGDLLLFGRVGFCFNLPEGQIQRKPVVHLEDAWA
ncbi:MAG: FHA domain-containing protein [Anaerolineales bacterium]|nr:FHA domain-containing protein [Anaerolineales bacterium]